MVEQGEGSESKAGERSKVLFYIRVEFLLLALSLLERLLAERPVLLSTLIARKAGAGLRVAGARLRS
jgi:hypothetical protein